MADLGDLGDLSGEGDFNDPMDPNGGIGGVADEAGNVAKSAVQTNISGPTSSLPETVKADIPEVTSEAVSSSLESIKTTPESVVGQQIQANVSSELKDPNTIGNIIDSSIEDAMAETGKSPDQLTTQDLKPHLESNVQAKIDLAKASYKSTLSGAVDSLDSSGQVKSGEFVNKMIDDPEGLKSELENVSNDPSLKDAGDQLDQKGDAQTDPDKKSALKEAGKKILEYGLKGLLVLAVIGAIIPGAGGPIDKLAGLAGQAIAKVVSAAASIVQALFGPFVKMFWNFLKSLKGPLIVIGLVLLIIFLVWLYKSIKGK